MGCWESGEGGILCDGACDNIDHWLEKKFGKLTRDKQKNLKILNKILSDKRLFMGLYNKVKKDFVEHNSTPYPKEVKAELKKLNEEIYKYEDLPARAFDRATAALYDRIDKIEKKYKN